MLHDRGNINSLSDEAGFKTEVISIACWMKQLHNGGDINSFSGEAGFTKEVISITFPVKQASRQR